MTKGKKKPLVLIVDDNAEFLEALQLTLQQDFVVLTAQNKEAFLVQMSNQLDVVLLDIRLDEKDPENTDGLLLLESINMVQHGLPVIMMTAFAEMDLAVKALRLGATDFIQKKNIDIREFRKVLNNAIDKSRLERKSAELEEELRRIKPWDLVGDDPSIHSIREHVDLVAQDGFCNVLIRGETGTGKELIARAIHQRGWRKDEGFVAVSIVGIPENLVESALFGHEKGSFTGAFERKIGFIEKAKGGVLFLDEIGELNMSVQVKLLRFLENKTFSRVGGTTEQTIDIQILAATNRNLEKAIQEGIFRDDLYFRLKTMEITMPPLRHRRGDVVLLADHFLSQFRQQGRTKITGFQPDTLECLCRYDFPGNVRELKGILERSMMFANNRRHSMIETKDLAGEIAQGARSRLNEHGQTPGPDFKLDLVLARHELEYIQQALETTNGVKSETWRLLGLNDRFALLRHVKRIRENYPELIDQFPIVQELY